MMPLFHPIQIFSNTPLSDNHAQLNQPDDGRKACPKGGERFHAKASRGGEDYLDIVAI